MVCDCGHDRSLWLHWRERGHPIMDHGFGPVRSGFWSVLKKTATGDLKKKMRDQNVHHGALGAGAAADARRARQGRCTTSSVLVPSGGHGGAAQDASPRCEKWITVIVQT